MINSSILTNITYCLVDILESSLKDMEEANKLEGKELIHSDKMYFNKAVFALNKLKGSVGTGEAYGNDSDMLYQFLKLLIDRCGSNDKLLFNFYNYIKAFPSALGMNLEVGERRAFKFIKP